MNNKKIKSLLLCMSFAAISNYAQNTQETASLIISGILPEPQNLTVHSELAGIHPDSIKGFNLKGKAKIPFGLSYFKDKPEQRGEESNITLELSRKITNEEGYELDVTKGTIKLKARSQKGLLYGMMTLEQLAMYAKELNSEIPACHIMDYPNSSYRALHIDLKHHIDKKEYMYQTLNKMAFYKLNAAIVEFEDKIKYESYPVVGAPQAWSINEWKKWCEYAHKLHIEISPLIQGIGHADFILKHDEMKHLRENPESDWVCCPSNEEYYKVQFGLYKDAISATPYGKYLHVGGDEVGTLGTCPLCKKKGSNALVLQMEWLKKVSQYAVKHGRIPIFWDDMVFKQVGLYSAILDQIPPQQVDSVWNKHLPELEKHICNFPKEVIYMRWQYGNANRPGNKKALQWYYNNGLKVMGATAAQTTYAMMPLGSFVDNIKSFQIARKEVPVEGVLCTAWDDASPLSETFWPGFIAHAQYSWNNNKEMDKKEFNRRYKMSEFGCRAASLPEFRTLLESTFPLWETGLLDKGVRRALYRTGGKFQIMTLPTAIKGEWTNKYQERIDKAKETIGKTYKLKETLSEYRKTSVRNNYSLQVFECINELTGYTAELLVSLSEYDYKRDFPSLNNLRLCIEKFSVVRQNMEHVYSQIRDLGQPKGYKLPMNHHAHLAIQTVNSDWMFLYEINFIKELLRYLNDTEISADKPSLN